VGRPPVAAPGFSSGFYSGAHLLWLLRLCGDDDLRDVFSLLILNLDLFASARVGVWSATEGSSSVTERGEFAAELGLRVTFTSDLVSKEAQEERR
jgi:hypothetical protein